MAKRIPLDNQLINNGVLLVLSVSDIQPTIGAPKAQLRFKMEVNCEASVIEKLQILVKYGIPHKSAKTASGMNKAPEINPIFQVGQRLAT